MARKDKETNVFTGLEESYQDKEKNQEASKDLKQNPKAVLEADYKEKYSKSKNKSETHIRRTFLIDSELSEKVDKLSAGKHGFKTEFFNKAIELLLTYYEDDTK